MELATSALLQFLRLHEVVLIGKQALSTLCNEKFSLGERVRYVYHDVPQLVLGLRHLMRRMRNDNYCIDSRFHGGGFVFELNRKRMFKVSAIDRDVWAKAVQSH